ncbi:MAG: hypothetical protein ACLTSX_02985 [Collinsella sp.]
MSASPGSHSSSATSSATTTGANPCSGTGHRRCMWAPTRKFTSSPAAVRPAAKVLQRDLVPHLLDSGHTPRIWGSFDSSWLAASGFCRNPRAVRASDGHLVTPWMQGQPQKRMFDKGFSLINILDNPNYMVPNGGGNRGAYGDYHGYEGTFTARLGPSRSSATRCCLPAIRGSWAPAFCYLERAASTRMPAVCQEADRVRALLRRAAVCRREQLGARPGPRPGQCGSREPIATSVKKAD